jgi:hypothetical protein
MFPEQSVFGELIGNKEKVLYTMFMHISDNNSDNVVKYLKWVAVCSSFVYKEEDR